MNQVIHGLTLFLETLVVLWIDNRNHFKDIILNCLRQPAHPIEREYFDAISHTATAQYIIQCLPEVGNFQLR